MIEALVAQSSDASHEDYAESRTGTVLTDEIQNLMTNQTKENIKVQLFSKIPT